MTIDRNAILREADPTAVPSHDSSGGAGRRGIPAHYRTGRMFDPRPGELARVEEPQCVMQPVGFTKEKPPPLLIPEYRGICASEGQKGLIQTLPVPRKIARHV